MTGISGMTGMIIAGLIILFTFIIFLMWVVSDLDRRVKHLESAHADGGQGPGDPSLKAPAS